MVNLAGALVMRYEYAHARDDLSRARKLLARALGRTSAGDIGPLNKIKSDIGRCSVLKYQYHPSKEETDLDDAIHWLREAVDLAYKIGDTEAAARSSMNLGQAYKLRSERGRDVGRDIAATVEAVGCFRYACLISGGGRDMLEDRRLDAWRHLPLNPELALQAARHWGELAEQISWAEAATAYCCGLTAMRQLVTDQVLRREKEHWIEAAGDLATRAAYAMSETGNLAKAVITLDNARSWIFLSLLETDQSALAALGGIEPELMDRYRRVAERLRSFQQYELGPGAIVNPSEILSSYADMWAAKVEFGKVIAELGAQAAVPATDLGSTRAAAVDQPLVYVLGHARGGLALVVHGTGDISSVRLPNLKSQDLSDLLRRYLAAYDRRRARKAQWRSELASSLGWLWDNAMSEIVAAVGAVETMAIIPFGVLAFLPLHAAGQRGAGPDHPGAWVIDRVAVGYAPNARTLLAARSKADDRKPKSVIGIGDPWPVKPGHLPYASAEISTIGSLFESRKILSGPAAEHDQVLRGMEGAAVSHFSCHGRTVWNNTLMSYLLLAHEAHLTVGEMLALHLENARLAVLSACETGIVDLRLPDEAVSLPSACLQIGFPGAIGTFWVVADGSTALLMIRFYELWLRDGIKPVLALRLAQAWLRDSGVDDLQIYLQERTTTSSANGTGAWIPKQAGIDLGKYVGNRVTKDDGLSHPYYWAPFAYYGV